MFFFLPNEAMGIENKYFFNLALPPNAALSNITAVYYVGGLCLKNNKKAAISG